MSKGILKFYNTNEKEDAKVIDSNSLMDKKLRELSALKKKAPATEYVDEDYSQYEEDGEFIDGIDADALDALTADDGAIIKNNAEELVREAQAKADEIVATAEQLAREFKENSRREAEIECTRIKADAKREGYADGMNQAEEEYSSRMAELDERAMQLQMQYDAAIKELEPLFVQTITDVYEHVFKVDLSEYQKLLTELVMDTMRGSDSSKTFIVHFSSDDFAGINEGQKEALEAAAAGSKVEIVEDIALGLNQCLIETDNGVIDCGLDTQLRELRKKLMLLSYTPSTEIQ